MVSEKDPKTGASVAAVGKGTRDPWRWLAVIATLLAIVGLFGWLGNVQPPGGGSPPLGPVELVELSPRDGGQGRGEMPTVGAGRFVLRLEARPEAELDHFVAELTVEGRVPLWRSDELQPEDDGSFLLLVDGVTIGSGPARVTLLGVRRGEEVEVHEYRFVLRP